MDRKNSGSGHIHARSVAQPIRSCDALERSIGRETSTRRGGSKREDPETGVLSALTRSCGLYSQVMPFESTVRTHVVRVPDPDGTPGMFSVLV